MSTLAVVRRSPLVPKRDLLLFDEIHVLDLDRQLDRLSGADLADALYLLDQGVMWPAKVPIEGLVDGLALPARPFTRNASHDRFDVLRIGGYTFKMQARNFAPESMRLEVDCDRLSMPQGVERFVAAAITESLGPLGHCTFIVDGQDPVASRRAFSGEIFVRVSRYSSDASYDQSISLRDLASGFFVDARGEWVNEAGRLGVSAAATDYSIFEAVIDAMPVPDDLEPLDSVLGFKGETIERGRLDRLGEWVQSMVMEGIESPRKLRLEIEGLLRQYETEMRAQRMMVRHEKVRTPFALPFGILRGLIGSANRDQLDVMTLREHKARLAQAEMTSPGRDLAYIASARERFQRDH